MKIITGAPNRISELGTLQTDDRGLALANETVRQAVRRARWKYTKPPLEVLAIILMVIGLYSAFFGYDKFFIFSPDLLFISGIIVMFFGAWYDFGASTYAKDLKDYYRKSLNDSDVTYIHKQQLIMTLIYIAIGGVYIGTGVFIYIVSLYV